VGRAADPSMFGPANFLGSIDRTRWDRLCVHWGMATSTVEDYVKAIYHLQQEAPNGQATVVRIAATLGITKGSVTGMVRKLCEADLARAERYGGVTLSPAGKRLALDMIRRHRLIEVFLVNTLGFDWSEVHEEAERLEHAMSAKVLDRLDAFLGRPASDPHGDPIPDHRGRMPDDPHTPLNRLSKGQRGVIARVSDQDAAFLAFAGSHGLRPGTRFTVLDVVPQAESVSLKAHRGQPVTLSFGAAAKIMVAFDDQESGRAAARSRATSPNQKV
jgi:DtxR family Mn-dependent transcriptional regulator